MTYAERKERAREKAIDWQLNESNKPMSWGEVAEWSNYFEKLGRRYGLLREFRENAIC